MTSGRRPGGTFGHTANPLGAQRTPFPDSLGSAATRLLGTHIGFEGAKLGIRRRQDRSHVNTPKTYRPGTQEEFRFRHDRSG